MSSSSSSFSSSLRNDLAQQNLQLIHKTTQKNTSNDMNAILGQGSFGTVYLTKETDDYGGRLRAVKVIDAAQWGEKGASKKQILAEVKNWVKLADSPHIVKYCQGWGWPTNGNNFYISMQYCSGGTLHAKLSTNPTAKVITGWLLQLTRGVAWMHDRNIVHRDLYLQNIFIDDRKNLRIGDFGLARSTTPQTTSEVGTLVRSCGYRPFWSPEKVGNLKKHKTSKILLFFKK